jgi:non-ribosomal peptide synthetase component F
LFVPDFTRRDVQAERMAGHLTVLLDAAAAEPELPVGRLALLPPEEAERVLTGFNDTAAEVPEGLLHTLFEQQVARTLQATALVFGEQELSYVELDTRAEALAARLRAAGVGPDVLVAICAERSVELVVGLLGIIHRVRDHTGKIPLIVSYDWQQWGWLPPSPLLFQRQFGAERRRISPDVIRDILNAALARTSLTDPSTGEPLRFTPHDFRRLVHHRRDHERGCRRTSLR